MEHLERFQAIADANGGTRVSGSPGYDDSADYVADKLEAAGYEVTRQEFEFPYFEEISSSFSQTAPQQRDFESFDFVTETGDYDVMTYSGSGTVEDALVVPTKDIVIPPSAEPSSTSGCELEDFAPASTTEDQVALIQRGGCDFVVKAQNAEAAGYDAAIVFNEGQEDVPDDDRVGVVLGTLGEPGTGIPVIGISFALGQELYGADGARVSLDVQTESEVRQTENVLADTPAGREDRTVVVGAHLDSVAEGPGINDNGSGSATILEVAEEMRELGIRPRNQVRFAFWGAEESGLFGSEHYVSTLTKRDIKDIAVNLNFDMLASPNYARFVYDGDGSATPDAGPTGSGVVEDVFTDYFASRDLETEPTAFDGRSDYGPFIDVGIPAGGLFTGAEDIKTEQEERIYGGVAGLAYDPCYHAACDTLNEEDQPEEVQRIEQAYGENVIVGNINTKALREMSDGVAHATLAFAQTTSAVGGTEKGSGTPSRDPQYKGPKALR
jgi:Zn-dependent M28 family amino/carboxypeptidase